MRYKIKQETKPTLPTFGKYKAVAVHNQTVESRQLCEEAARDLSISGVRLHFIPESAEGTLSLYEGITFERERD